VIETNDDELSRERRSARTRRWFRIAAVLVIALLTIWGAREGWWGETLSFSLELSSAQTNLTTEWNSSVQRRGTNGPGPSLGGRPTTCTATCRPHGTLCDVLLAELHCDGAQPLPGATAIAIDLAHEGSGCSWLPLFTDEEVTFSGHGTAAVSVAHGSADASYTFGGRVEHEAFGLHSCRAAQQTIGARIGRDLGRRVRELVRED
jgi:hypothetical protein